MRLLTSFPRADVIARLGLAHAIRLRKTKKAADPAMGVSYGSP